MQIAQWIERSEMLFNWILLVILVGHKISGCERTGQANYSAYSVIHNTGVHDPVSRQWGSVPQVYEIRPSESTSFFESSNNEEVPSSVEDYRDDLSSNKVDEQRNRRIDSEARAERSRNGFREFTIGKGGLLKILKIRHERN